MNSPIFDEFCDPNEGDALKGKFITCYQADNSIDKICRSPLWDRELCLKILRAGAVSEDTES